MTDQRNGACNIVSYCSVLVDVFDNDSRTRSIPLLQDRAAAWDKTSSQQRPQILGVNLL